MKHPTRRGNKPFPLTDDEINYIRSHHSSQTVLKMALHLKRHPKRIYKYLYGNNLEPFGHPGRKRKIEGISDVFNVDARKGEYSWLV